MIKTIAKLFTALIELTEQYDQGLITEDEFRNRAIELIDLFRP